MIDLKSIQEKIDKLFATISDEELKQWIINQRKSP